MLMISVSVNIKMQNNPSFRRNVLSMFEAFFNKYHPPKTTE